jgi:hypothetical protein
MLHKTMTMFVLATAVTLGGSVLSTAALARGGESRFQSRSIFDFCNSICQERTSRSTPAPMAYRAECDERNAFSQFEMMS